MQDNAPSHASKYSTAWLASQGLKDERRMTWPPSSPDLNPIVGPSHTGDLRWRKTVHLSELCLAVVAAAQKVDRQQIKQLTDSMNGRLMTVIAKKGGYIGHWFFVWNVRNVYL